MVSVHHKGNLNLICSGKCGNYKACDSEMITPIEKPEDLNCHFQVVLFQFTFRWCHGMCVWCVCMCVCVRACVGVCVCIFVCLYMYVYIYTYVYAYIHTYVCKVCTL